MGRRSLLKRVGRGITSLQKLAIKGGRNIEKRIGAWALGTAGPELVQATRECCLEGQGECLCQKNLILFFHTRAACYPGKISKFRREYAYFKSRISSPGTIVMGDLKYWITTLFGCALFFYLGTSIGRWNLFGFAYDREPNFDEV